MGDLVMKSSTLNLSKISAATGGEVQAIHLEIHVLQKVNK